METLLSLEVRILKSRCLQDCAPPEALEGNQLLVAT